MLNNGNKFTKLNALMERPPAKHSDVVFKHEMFNAFHSVLKHA